MIKSWIESRRIKRLELAANDKIYLRIRRNKKRIEGLIKADQRFFRREIEELEEEIKNLQAQLESFL